MGTIYRAKNIRKVICLAAISLLYTTLIVAQNKNKHYKIYDTRQQEEITLSELASRLNESDVVFFGEEHDDSITHTLQYALFKNLHENNNNITLSLEMFQSDIQLILDEYLAGIIKETNLSKDGRLWANYSDYRPLIEYAKELGIPVIAANAPSRYTNLVSREGLTALEKLSKTAKNYLAPIPIDTLTGAYYDNFALLLGGHENMGSMKIYQSQNLWDATMAYRIAQWSKKHKSNIILHLNGRFHSDEKLGVMAQLKKYRPKLKSINISAFKHEDIKSPRWQDFEHLGDYIILTEKPIGGVK
ncbi:ChaN family lipoprotein [Olivibacter sitiensis]|uniref:ChaN family lipoprotein n=1 Tax=Olivibacter sitiensis TaxID=376470 RepID=UPI0004009A6F|nr:ChaN family lipoprotein [Olivibacter sitiensis]